MTLYPRPPRETPLPRNRTPDRHGCVGDRAPVLRIDSYAPMERLSDSVRRTLPITRQPEVVGPSAASDALAASAAVDRLESKPRRTVWIALIAIPFSYGTNLLPARMSPETLGCFQAVELYNG
jgi:hypothetical protein